MNRQGSGAWLLSRAGISCAVARANPEFLSPGRVIDCNESWEIQNIDCPIRTNGRLREAAACAAIRPKRCVVSAKSI